MDPADADDLERHHLHRLELALARRDRSLVEVPLEELLDPDFGEVGSSGRLWNRAAMVELLRSDPPSDVRIDDFSLTFLADGIALVRYRSVTGVRSALRTSIWIRRLEGWRLRFHQGTPGPATAG